MFEGKLVSLRALEKEDLSILKEWRNTLHVRKSTREYKLLNMINQKNWFESIHQSNPPSMWRLQKIPLRASSYRAPTSTTPRLQYRLNEVLPKFSEPDLYPPHLDRKPFHESPF